MSTFMCFYGSQNKKNISSLNSIWVIFVTETESVYCEAQTEYLNLIRDNFRVKGLNT